MTIGERIKEVRKDFQLSPAEFAQCLLSSRSHIANLEAGRKPVTERMKRNICVEFNVNQEWLETGQGDKYNIAVKDVMDLREAARGKNPTDIKGNLKAQAIELAARLNEIYPYIAASCESVDDLICLLRVPEIADIFNTIATAVLLSEQDQGRTFKIICKIFGNILTNDDISLTSDDEKQERIRKYFNTPLPNYLHSLYAEYKKDGIAGYE